MQQDNNTIYQHEGNKWTALTVSFQQPTQQSECVKGNEMAA